MVDNFLDISHFPYVHTGTFGRAQDTLVPTVESSTRRRLLRLPLRGRWPTTDRRAGQRAGAAVVDRRDDHRVPSAVPRAQHDPLRHRARALLLLLSTPVDDVTSLFTFVVWRNDDFAVPAEEVIRFDLAIGAEDKRMLELVPGLLPLDPTTLVSVQADRCSVEWRRRLAAAIAEASRTAPHVVADR